MIRLPPFVFEHHLTKLLARIWQPTEGDYLDIDFSRCKYYIPAAIAALIGRIDHAKNQRTHVRLHGLERCQNLRHLERIDFFNQLNVVVPDYFARQDGDSVLVPLREIVPDSVRLPDDPLATELASCMSGDTQDEAFYLSQYALGEVIANVQQHAGRRGFVCAEYAQPENFARIGVADSGVGIREGFRVNRAPNYHEAMSDLDVLELAMSLGGSSTRHLNMGPYGKSPNRGVGLTMVRFMVANSYGHFFLASGNAWWYRNGLGDVKRGSLPGGVSMTGTLVSAAYRREQVVDYGALREQAWQMPGLTEAEETDILFT